MKELNTPIFSGKASDIVHLVTWIDDKFFIKAEIEVRDLLEALKTIQEDGINQFPEAGMQSRFTHYPPHRISRIDVNLQNETTTDKD